MAEWGIKIHLLPFMRLLTAFHKYGLFSIYCLSGWRMRRLCCERLCLPELTERDGVIQKICRPLIFMSLLAIYISPAERRCTAPTAFWEALGPLSSQLLKCLKQNPKSWTTLLNGLLAKAHIWQRWQRKNKYTLALVSSYVHVFFL